MEKSYWAKLYVDDDGYSVEVPDLPGCLTCNSSRDGALCMAQDAVRGWLETTLEDGDPLPKARSKGEIEALELDPVLGSAELVEITVTPFADASLTLPGGLWADLGKVSQQEGVPVHELLARATREYLAKHHHLGSALDPSKGI